MALFLGIQEYIALDANNIALVFDTGNSVSISGNIFLYPLKAIQYYIIIARDSIFILRLPILVGSARLLSEFSFGSGRDNMLSCKSYITGTDASNDMVNIVTSRACFPVMDSMLLHIGMSMTYL